MLHDAFPVTRHEEWESILNESETSRRRNKVEVWLDRGAGECWLRNWKIAKIVEDKIRRDDRKRYELRAWSIMPNHVHLVVDIWETPLSKLLNGWKGSSAREANQRLDRRGQFWEGEYFDTLIRDEEHLKPAIRYTENNPVKAGFVAERGAWQWGSARHRDYYEHLPLQSNRPAA
jgi:REP element-mobilizing transposase RayT